MAIFRNRGVRRNPRGFFLRKYPMPINSKQKGNRGERELAAFLKDHGIDARRGQQFSGSPDSPDVVHDIPGIHIEVKRTERLSLYKALQQAREDCGEDVPTVWHRANRKQWVVILDAEDFLRMTAK